MADSDTRLFLTILYVADENLKSSAEEASSVVQSHVGREAYADAMKVAVVQASTKRATRKRLQATAVSVLGGIEKCFLAIC